VVEHKDRLTRFGFNYIRLLLQKTGKDIEVVNEDENDKQDLESGTIFGISKQRVHQLLKKLRTKEN